MESLKINNERLIRLRSTLQLTAACAGIAVITALSSCNSKNQQSTNADSVNSAATAATDRTSTSYVSLNAASNGSSTIVKDTTDAGGYVYSDTYKPIDDDILFVDVSTGDTLYGPSGIIVNNSLIEEEGKWKLDETKIKRDGDKIKIKSGDDKLKLDDDEMKMKTGDSKMKTDDDEAKLKTPDSKTKVEDDETKVKPH